MAPRRCETCGGWITPPTQCKPCRAAKDRARRKGTPRTEYAGNWTYNSQQLRQQWIELHGHWCPGWTIQPDWPGRPPHPATDLVVDHDLGVMCRSCNSHKAATYDRARAKAARSTNNTPSTNTAEAEGDPPPTAA